jgi:hypothetical protein
LQLRAAAEAEGKLAIKEETKPVPTQQSAAPVLPPKAFVPLDTACFDICRSTSRIAIESKELHHIATARLDRWARYKKTSSDALKASSGFTSLPAGTMTAGAAALAKELGLESNTAALA